MAKVALVLSIINSLVIWAIIGNIIKLLDKAGMMRNDQSKEKPQT